MSPDALAIVIHPAGSGSSRVSATDAPQPQAYVVSRTSMATMSLTNETPAARFVTPPA